MALTFTRAARHRRAAAIRGSRVTRVKRGVGATRPLGCAVGDRERLAARPTFLTANAPFNVGIVVSFFPVFRRLICRFQEILRVDVRRGTTVTNNMVGAHRRNCLFAGIAQGISVVRPLILLPRPTRTFRHDITTTVVSGRSFPLVGNVTISGLCRALVRDKRRHFLVVCQGRGDRFLRVVLRCRGSSSGVLLLFRGGPRWWGVCQGNGRGR